MNRRGESVLGENVSNEEMTGSTDQGKTKSDKKSQTQEFPFGEESGGLPPLLSRPRESKTVRGAEKNGQPRGKDLKGSWKRGGRLLLNGNIYGKGQ